MKYRTGVKFLYLFNWGLGLKWVGKEEELPGLVRYI